MTARHDDTMRREARRLRRAGGAPAEPLAQALKDASRRRPDAVASAWYERIEAERRRLRASDQALSGGRNTTATVGEVTKKASVPTYQAELLFNLVRRLDARRCLEMGTCVGISGAYLAAAMTTGRGGRLLSLEGHEDRATVARDTWRRLGFDSAEVLVGRFSSTLATALDSGPYDLVFVDGHHDGDATIDYVTRIRMASRPGALLVLDDVDWSEGMRAAWGELQVQLSGSTISDLGRLGIVRLSPEDAGLPSDPA